ncbi:unnamed protein product, partial [Closterium sp. NIES-54]
GLPLARALFLSVACALFLSPAQALFLSPAQALFLRVARAAAGTSAIVHSRHFPSVVMAWHARVSSCRALI